MTYPALQGGDLQPNEVYSEYDERGIVEAYAATYALPLSGEHRVMLLTGDITISSTGKPTAPVCGKGSITLIQDGTGGHSVGYAEIFSWPGGVPFAAPTGANERMTLLLSSLPDGAVEARAQVMSQ